MSNGDVFRRHKCPDCGHKAKTVERELDIDSHTDLRLVSVHDLVRMKATILDAVVKTIENTEVGQTITIWHE